jgi:hypothetical protein
METVKQDVSLRSYAKLASAGQGKRMLPLNDLLCHEGNLKIPSTTAIFNMSSATDCPSMRLGLCKAAKKGVKCYARKSEYEYHPFVLPFRRRQEAYWREVSAHSFAADFLFINALKEVPFTALRFNEAGDFHSQDCVNKAEEIAMYLARFGIKCYCYTSRSDLDFRNCKHLIVSGSSFSNPKKGVTKSFTIVFDVKDKPKGWSVCPMDCRKCNRCMVRNANTVVKAH